MSSHELPYSKDILATYVPDPKRFQHFITYAKVHGVMPPSDLRDFGAIIDIFNTNGPIAHRVLNGRTPADGAITPVGLALLVKHFPHRLLAKDEDPPVTLNKTFFNKPKHIDDAVVTDVTRLVGKSGIIRQER